MTCPIRHTPIDHHPARLHCESTCEEGNVGRRRQINLDDLHRHKILRAFFFVLPKSRSTDVRNRYGYLIPRVHPCDVSSSLLVQVPHRSTTSQAEPRSQSSGTSWRGLQDCLCGTGSWKTRPSAQVSSICSSELSAGEGVCCWEDQIDDRICVSTVEVPWSVLNPWFLFEFVLD